MEREMMMTAMTAEVMGLLMHFMLQLQLLLLAVGPAALAATQSEITQLQ